MALTAVLGVALAFLVERTDVPAKPLWHGLLVAPLAVPAFVNSYAWVSLDRSIVGYGGALLVITLSYYPLVYLPVVAALRGLDPALEEAAWSLGQSRWHSFRTVVLPQLRPALFGGVLLVGLHLLAEFGALQLIRFQTFTTAIYDQYGSTFNGAAANMIAGVLVLCCLLLLLGELRLRGHRRLARVGWRRGPHGGAGPPRPRPCPVHRRPGRAGRALARRADVRPGALAAGGLLDGVPGGGAHRRGGLDHRVRRHRRGRHHRAGGPGRVARRPLPRHADHRDRAQHVRRQRAARDRRRAGAGHGVAAAGAGHLPDRAAARPGVRRDVPAPGRGVGAGGPGAGAAGARRRGPQPGGRSAEHGPPGDPAGDRARASVRGPPWCSSRSEPSSPPR